ncbi:hypothetical protein [Clostridium guangxiense]|uniref:hypothetical protein n=1 Tax=Clostridium guangxiense TaxID=1662055 RepID=UPI001E3BD289|nr:hypothetical protein [Clostridium guangxiense]MCD2347858.1 hypothetical protein [Clostridium guangxiense]
MKIHSKLLMTIIKSQLLSIIYALISRIKIDLITAYTYMFKDIIVLSLSLILFTAFCIITSIIFLNKSIINVFLISITYIIYWRIFLSISFIHTSNPNDYGVGILGLSLEVIWGLFDYFIVILSSVIAVSIHINRIDKVTRLPR